VATVKGVAMSEELRTVIEERFLSLESKLTTLEKTFAALQTRFDKEMYSWRGLAIFLIVLFTCIVSTGYVFEERQRGLDNKERAYHWTIMEQGLERNRAMVSKNYDTVMLVDEHLRQCSGCHSHPTTTK
jgi:hypothetical protein